MSAQNDGGPAFPVYSADDAGWSQVQGGMTLRQYAAIKLRVPESGTDWLDDMIRKAQRAELAAKALQGFCVNHDPGCKATKAEIEGGVRVAYQIADAMLKAREVQP